MPIYEKADSGKGITPKMKKKLMHGQVKLTQFLQYVDVAFQLCHLVDECGGMRLYESWW
jgi:hypothetical protein